MSSSSSPCAACKFLRRKCTQECVFAPYFPADQPQKFASVHKVFGASNVAKLLSELNVTQREDAVRSLVYEADARLSDPIYGCVGLISILQHRLRQLHQELEGAKKELSTYIGPQAMGPMLHPSPFMQQQQQQQQQQNLGYPSSSSSVMPHGMMPLMGMPSGPIHGGQLVMREPRQQYQHHAQQPQQHDIIEAQQLAAAAVAAREQQEMYRAYEQQQQQPQQQLQQQHQTQQPQQQLDLLRSNSGFEGTVPVTATGFHHHLGAGAMPPSLALGTSDNPYQVQPQADNQWLLFQPEQAEAQPHSQSQLETPQTQQQPQVSGSNERGSFGPSWSILLKLLFLATVFEAIFHSSP